MGLFEKIKEIFAKLFGSKMQEGKQLPAPVSKNKELSIRDRIKIPQNGVRGINLEKEYSDGIKEYEEICKKIEQLTAKMELKANGIDLNIIEEDDNGNKNYQEASKKILEEKISKKIKKNKEEAEKGNTRVGDSPMMRSVVRMFANREWKENTLKYMEEACNVVSQVHQAKGDNRNILLSEEEKTRCEEMEELLTLEKELMDLKGILLGIDDAVLEKSVIDEDSKKKLEAIRSYMDKTEKISEVQKVEAEEKALPGKDVSDIDIILYYAAKGEEFLCAALNRGLVDCYKTSNARSKRYLENGGNISSKEVFCQRMRGPISYFNMDEKEEKRLLEKYEELTTNRDLIGNSSNDGQAQGE